MDPQRININNTGINVNPLNIKHTQPNANAVKPAGQSFGEALIRAAEKAEDTQQISGLKFSKHAATRVNSREVDLSPEQLKRVEDGVTAALVKGVSDSLVLVDDYALVVNTRSMTVITAMNSSQRSDGVFTNINGAVIV